MLDIHKEANSAKLKFFLSFKATNTDQLYDSSDLNSYKGIEHLLANSHVVYLNNPRSIKKYMERMHAEDIIPQNSKYYDVSQKKSA